VRVGQHASFTVQAYADHAFDGLVTQIRQAPVTVQSVVTYDVVVAVDNPDKLLLPGMTADTHIVTAVRRQVLRVPLAALRFLPSFAGRRRPPAEGAGGEERRRGRPGHRVWVLRDGALTPVPVTVGLDDGSLVEVASDDLHAGDRVVLAQSGGAEQRRPAPQAQRRPPGMGFRF
jgi:HlyD family secretion protein